MAMTQPQPHTSSTKRPVWVITGASSGIGRAIALEVASWATVIAIGRDPAGLEQVALLGCRTVILDITSPSSEIQSTVDKVVQEEGHIDVLINAAGFILEGAVEETNDAELLLSFNTNLFGPIRLIRAVLPYMRSRRDGTIANIAGIGSLKGAPNAGVFCATKAALATLTESLRAETADLGIKICLIQLGHFRTSFLRPGHRVKVQSPIPDYDSTLAPVREAFDNLDCNQPGDPAKAAQVITQALASTGSKFPSLLPVGSDVLQAELSSHTARLQEMLDWHPLTGITDFEV